MSVAIADIVARCQSCGGVMLRPVPESAPRYLVAGPMTLDLERWTATIGGQVIEFAPAAVRPNVREWAILTTLARRAGRIVEYPELVVTVFGYSYDRPSHWNVTVTVCRLRHRLGEHGALIVTHRGRGLRLAVGGTP